MDSVVLMCISMVVLCLIALVVIIKYKSKPSEDDLHVANFFLNRFDDTINNMMLNAIREFNYSEFDNMLDIKSALLLKIDELCNNYITEQVDKSSLTPIQMKAIKKSLAAEYIDKLISNFNIESVIETHASNNFQQTLDESVKEDEQLQEEYSSEEEYFANEESSNDNLEVVTEESIEQLKVDEEMDKKEIKPVREDGEEEYNSEDPSMEILKDDETGDEEESDIYYDAKGRARSRSTGKFIKVTGL